MNLLLQFHSLFRWVVLALGFVGMVISFYQLRSPQRARLGNLSATVFLAALDLQWLLGLVLAIAGGSASSAVVLHGAVMTLAVALAHGLKRMAGQMPPGRMLVYRFLAPVAVILAGHLLLVS